MIERLNIEQFRQFKTAMQEVISRYEKLEQENPQLAEESMPQVVDEYFSIQSRLLSYDLRDIPFEEWDGLGIIGDENHIADFSVTHANIDFLFLDYSGYGNLSGCNIKNLERLNPNFLEHTVFSAGVIDSFIENLLPNTFSSEWKQKYFSRNITMEDLEILSPTQLDVLPKNTLDGKLSSNQDSRIISILGLEKAIEFYRYSNQEYSQVKEMVDVFFHHSIYSNVLKVSEELKKTPVDKMKETLFSIARKNALESIYDTLKMDNFPPAFVRENRDIFLLDSPIPEDLKERYYQRKLTLENFRDFHDAFGEIPVEYFTDDYRLKRVIEVLGSNNFLALLPHHFDVIEHIVTFDEIYNFEKYFHSENNIEMDFLLAIKQYFKEVYLKREGMKTVENGKSVYSIPEWLSSMNFSVYESISTEEDLNKLLNENTNPIILDNKQNEFVEILGIGNLRRFEQETGLFSYKKYGISNGLILIQDTNQLSKDLIAQASSIKDLSYEKFQDVLAEFLDKHKKYIDYNYVQGEFRNKYPEMFIDENAPVDLQLLFYSQLLSPKIIFEHPEYISFLREKKLENCFQEMFVDVVQSDNSIARVSLYELLRNKMDFNSTMYFIRDYSDVLDIIRSYSLGHAYQLETTDISKFLLEIGKMFQDVIIEKGIPYSERIPKSIQEIFPEMFLPESVPQEIRDKFYKRMLKAQDFASNPDLLKMMGNTNIAYGFLEEAWVVRLFAEETDIAKANENRLKIMSAYSEIGDALLKKEFKQYLLNFDNAVDMEKVSFISQVFERLSHSNSSEMFTFRESLARQILSSPHPLDSLNKIEDVFLKNNIPMVGKIYSCFDILHPDFEGFNFDNNMVSPVLKGLSTRGRKMVVFSDLIKSSFGSNNRSVNSYLNNIEIGARLYEEVLSGRWQYEELDDYYKKELIIFSKHLATLYNNTVKGKKEAFQYSENPIADISNLSKLLSPDGTLDYNIADRVIKMFCGFTGIKTLEGAKNYIHSTVTNAEERNRLAAQV